MLRILLFLFLSAPFVFAEEINDPFEELNGISFEFNESMDKYFLWHVSISRHEDHQKVLLQSKRILKAPNSWSAHFPN